jgi:hypothetical protein
MVGWSKIFHGFVFGLALTACQTAADGDADEPLEVVEISTGELAEICPATRIIGRAKLVDMGAPPTCPARTHWTVTNLFESGTPYLDAHPPDFTPAVGTTEMGLYCLYQWAGAAPAPSPTQLSALKDTLIQPARDCLAVQGQSVPMNEQIGPILQEIFRDLAGQVTTTNLEHGGAILANDRSGVLVSVVDTVPYAQPVHMNWPHGEYLARIIEDLACPEGDACPVEVARVLAMPRVTATETDFQHGGVAGLLTDLARGLMEAQRRWELGDTTRKHIVNLSLGFDESSIDSPVPQLANIDAIHTALQYLSCKGAIVIAAAGNADEVGCTTDAVYPARWQRELAPGVMRCGELGVTIAGPPPATQPLLYAAAGTQLDGELLASARTGGLPRLAAIADHAIGGDAEDDNLTGSSVAAAVTSAAAAMAWSYADNRTGPQVMESVWAGARPTDIGNSNMVVPSTTAVVKQVNVCGALTQACVLGTCPVFDQPCSADTVADPPLSDLDFAYDAELLGEAVTNAPVQCGAEYEICGADAWAGSVDHAADACVATERHPIERLVDPQPPQPGCPPCTFKAVEKTLYMSLSEDYAEDTVTNVSVVFTDNQGVDHPVDLGVPAIDAYSTKAIPIDARDVPASIKRMTVTVAFDEVRPINDVLLR